MDHRRLSFAAALLLVPALALGQATTNPATRPATEPAAEKPSRLPREGPERVGWWNDRVFYQVFVRSFADSTTGPLANDGNGDLRGLIEKLDQLNDGDPSTTSDLGVTGLWLMPICQSDSYHGYDVVDFMKIERDYGTNEDFKDLIAACEKRGIKVIIDLVINHISSKHPWFRESAAPNSPKRDWFIWSAKDPGYRGPWNQPVWHKQGNAFYYGLFSGQMPDLNFGNPEVTKAIEEVTRFWLKDLGTHGFRLDAIRHLIEDGEKQDNTPGTHEWLKQWYKVYKGQNPEAFAVGEVWAPTNIAAQYVGGKMDATFEFDLADAMVDAAKRGTNARFNGVQGNTLLYFPPNQYGRFLTNHDQPRVMTQLGGNEGAMRAAAQLLLLGPGVPFIYYGEEIGMTGGKPDPDIRTPMQWTGGKNGGFSAGKPWRKLNTGFEKRNVETERKDPASLWNLYRKLIAFRQANPAILHGQCDVVTASKPGVAAMVRTGKRADGSVQQLLVVVNLTGEPVTDVVLSADRSSLRVAGGRLSGKEIFNATAGGEAMTGPTLRGSIGMFIAYTPIAKLEPYGAYVLELERGK